MTAIRTIITAATILLAFLRPSCAVAYVAHVINARLFFSKLMMMCR